MLPLGMSKPTLLNINKPTFFNCTENNESPKVGTSPSILNRTKFAKKSATISLDAWSSKLPKALLDYNQKRKNKSYK